VVLVVEGVGPVLHPVLKMELLTLEAVAVEEVVVFLQPVTVALALSSSRPINNEDAWKLKSIGCMESTPQCTF
jgi:hypothetical protein